MTPDDRLALLYLALQAQAKGDTATVEKVKAILSGGDKSQE